jgi:5-methylthioadenosine/S-adenosylhomocysteine deaminase
LTGTISRAISDIDPRADWKGELYHTERVRCSYRLYFGPLSQRHFAGLFALMQSKESADLVIFPRWLLPMAQARAVLSNHAVAVHGGRILAVGPAHEITARFEAREQIARPDHVLLPGFVNAHTRASMSLLRGLPVRGPVMRWMRETVAPAELRSLSPDFVRAGTQLAIAEMLRAGITCFADSYRFPEEAARAVSEARVRAAIGLPVAEGSGAWTQLWDEYRSSPWVSLYFALPPSFAASDALLTRLRSVADELDARIAMPLHETEVEVRDTLGQHGRRPIERLAEIGLLRPGFTALHMNRVEAHDIDLARQTGISAVACQQSNLRLGSGTCPVAKLAERGVTVGLGTDSPVSAGAFDLMAEARLAALLGNGAEGSPSLSAMDVLAHATLGGAAALGLSSLCGSVEVGKAADLTCIDLAALGSPPAADVADTLVFSATRHQVSDVWVAGRAAVNEGRLLAFDEQEMLALGRSWAERIQLGVAA